MAAFQQTDLFSADAKKKTKANKELEKLSTAIEKLEKEKNDIQNNAIYKEAFEWRFEFPEVLNNEGKYIGFDVVIGNPPYVRQEEFVEIKKYLQDRFEVYNSISDLLTYFIELSNNILKQHGDFSFIVSNKFTQANYGKNLRNFILNKVSINEFLDFSGVPIFDNATVDASILSFNKNQKGSSSFIYANILSTYFNNSVYEYLKLNSSFFSQSSLSSEKWVFDSSLNVELKKKIREKGIKLKKWSNIKINYGLKTGLNEAFFIDSSTRDKLINEDPKSSEIIKPLARGKDIQKYFIEPNHQWLICTHNGVKSKKIKRVEVEKEYTAIYKYLLQFKDKLEKRYDKGDAWYNLRDCAYLQDFEVEKILYPNMTAFLPFVYDLNGFFSNDKSFFIVGTSLKYLVAFLNSSLFKYTYKDIFPELLGGTRELRKVFMEEVEVIQVDDNMQQPFITLVDQILAAKKANPQADTSHWEKEIDALVYQLYGLTEEEIKIVAGN